MQLLPHQHKEEALRELACAATGLLTSGQLDVLAGCYGYALACGRDSTEAIRDDLSTALAEASATTCLPLTPQKLSVVYFRRNATGLVAAVDCEPATDGRPVWISLVCTGTDTQQFFGLEEICAAP